MTILEEIAADAGVQEEFDPLFREYMNDASFGRLRECITQAILSALRKRALQDDVVEAVAWGVQEYEDRGPMGEFPDGAPMRSATWNAYNERQHQEFRDTGKAAITALFDKLEAE